MKKLDTSSLEKYETSVEEYRKIFKDDVIGAFDYPLEAANPRSRKAYDNKKLVVPPGGVGSSTEPWA